MAFVPPFVVGPLPRDRGLGVRAVPVVARLTVLDIKKEQDQPSNDRDEREEQPPSAAPSVMQPAHAHIIPDMRSASTWHDRRRKLIQRGLASFPIPSREHPRLG